MTTIQKVSIEGKGFFLVPEDEYEDLMDIVHARQIQAKYPESVPSEIAEAIILGESPIRAFRKWRDLTMAELASKAGVTQPAIADLESGRRKGRPETLKAIAAALRVEMEDLI